MNPNCYRDDFGSEDSTYSSSSSSSSSNAKKLKCDDSQQQQQEDVISNLPDSLLHHIFSFLDIKHAIHTCVLSKKWKDFWKFVPTFNFVYKPKPSEKQPLKFFTHFVDQVLKLRDRSNNIHRFAITHHPYNPYDKSDCITSNLETWILNAVQYKVEELSLDFNSYSTYRLPHCLFTSESLIKLEIHCSGCGKLNSSSFIGFPDKISLPKLKTLYIDSVCFRDKCLSDDIIPNCPNLKSLILNRCGLATETFDICSLKLKELVFRKCRPFNIWFNINVPNLISFHHYNYVGSLTFGCKNEDKYEYVLHLVHILKKLCNVEVLKLSAPHLQFLTEAPDLSEFCNLRCLLLESTCISKDFNRAVSYLLKLSPNLETFGLTTCVRDCIIDDCWEAGFSSDSNCVMMNHLTVFELRVVEGLQCELKFIEVLLKNAKVLERLVINFIPYFSYSSETKESCFIFMEKVIALPRSSLSSTILFKSP